MGWREKANEILGKIKKYRDDTDGWKQAKSSEDGKDATVWWKPSPDWDGALYKAESLVYAEPDVVFSYIDPTPDGPRSKWDKAVKELNTVERIENDIAVVQTVTHNAFGGLISSRDFVDLCVTERTDDYISTSSVGIEHESCAPSSNYVRGKNHPCAIICYKVPGEPNQTRVMSYIQTDLGGMLPKALVENALPSNMVDFFKCLRKSLQEGGHWKGAECNGS